jgi:hypothetical protein
MRQLRDALRTIKTGKWRPGTAFRIIESADVLVFAASANCQHVVRFPGIEDTWSGKTVTDLRTLKGAERIISERMGLKFSDRQAYKVGSGKQEVAIFFDPAADLPAALFTKIPDLKKYS